jgi:hypothetical protein
MNTICCVADLIECAACANNISPGDFCSVHGNADQYQHLCVTSAPADECGHANGFPSPAIIRNVVSDRRLYAQEGHEGEAQVGADAGATVFSDQQWSIEDAGEGLYWIRNVASSRRLFAQSNSEVGEIGVGAHSTGQDLPDQKWYVEEDANCRYILRNYHSGRRLYAQSNKVWQDGVGANAIGHLYADQKWYIEEA